VSYERRSKRRADEGFSHSSVTRVATSATETPVAGQGIEDVTVDPSMHLHDPHNHSSASQQATVSVSHGVEPHRLSASYLETVDIETTKQLPPLSTSFYARRVLEPLTVALDVHSFSRTLLEELSP